MRKLRCSLATVALLATLAGAFLVQGMGAASLASAASHHVGASSVVGQSVAFKIHPPCGSGVGDC
jgi:hypothetical protein